MNALSPVLWTWLGVGLIAVIVVQISVDGWKATKRRRNETRRQQLEIARLTAELAATREARQKRVQETGPWNGFRKFVVKQRVEEADHICSFHLVPHDAKPLPPFKPGQYLTFRLAGAGREGGQLIRCYSLSDHPHQPHYRVTIKRVLPLGGIGAGGAGSTLFHAQVKERDILDVRAASGNFCLDPHDSNPVVLIGGGIGITPIYSMLATLVHLKSPRAVWVYYGVRNRREHVFRAELAAIARDHPNIHVRICYSQPGADDRPGDDYHIAGRITPDLLRRELPSNDFAFYYCGPGLMMEALTSGLKAWGVPESRLHFEAFGPLSVKRVSHAIAGAPAPAKHSVSFRKTGRTVPWDESRGTVLDLAELAGINIPSGCRTGNCGTCVVPVHSGDVTYIQPPGTSPEARTCLACIAHPKGDLVLDA
jgi:ferredoxin-NADP reductase